MTLAPRDGELEYLVRELVDDDWALVLNSWKKSARDSSTLPGHVYYTEIHARIERLRDRGARWVVACNPLDNDQVYAWAVAEPPVVHYAYTKKPFRRQGIARRLVRELIGDAVPVPVTSWTKCAQDVHNAHTELLTRLD